MRQISTGVESIAVNLLLLLLLLLDNALSDSEPKEIERVIIGSKSSEGEGVLVAPDGFPDEPYPLDSTSYIFVLENTELEGSVRVALETFDINPKSWLTVRNSKYGGYVGRVLGRYDEKHDPPAVFITDTCCLRLEFEVGCCDSANLSHTGIKATYKFIQTPGKGRRSDCKHDRVFTKLCNGECIPPSWECPCPLYGQYKCDNSICIDRDKVCDGQDHCGDSSDETFCEARNLARIRPEGLGVMYSFSVIITTVCSMLGFVCVIMCVLCSAENITKHSKDSTKEVRSLSSKNQLQNYAKPWPQPESHDSPRMKMMFIAITNKEKSPATSDPGDKHQL